MIVRLAHAVTSFPAADGAIVWAAGDDRVSAIDTTTGSVVETREVAPAGGATGTSGGAGWSMLRVARVWQRMERALAWRDDVVRLPSGAHAVEIVGAAARIELPKARYTFPAFAALAGDTLHVFGEAPRGAIHVAVDLAGRTATEVGPVHGVASPLVAFGSLWTQTVLPDPAGPPPASVTTYARGRGDDIAVPGTAHHEAGASGILVAFWRDTRRSTWNARGMSLVHARDIIIRANGSCAFVHAEGTRGVVAARDFAHVFDARTDDVTVRSEELVMDATAVRVVSGVVCVATGQAVELVEDA